MATIRGNFKAQYYDIGFSKDICYVNALMLSLRLLASIRTLNTVVRLLEQSLLQEQLWTSETEQWGYTADIGFLSGVVTNWFESS